MPLPRGVERSTIRVPVLHRDGVAATCAHGPVDVVLPTA
jgi:hypothetical protein